MTSSSRRRRSSYSGRSGGDQRWLRREREAVLRVIGGSKWLGALQVKPFGNISTPFTMIGQYFSTQSMLNTLVEPLFKYLNQAWWWWRWWPLEAIHRSQTFLHLVWYDTRAQIHLGLIGLWSYSCIMVKFTRDVHNGCIQRDSRAEMVIWAEGESQEMGNIEGWKDVENKKWKYRNKLWSNIITFPMLGLTTSSERASFIRRSVTTWKSRITKDLEFRIRNVGHYLKI